MPRADNLSSSTQLIKGPVLGFEKSGTSGWAAREAMAGFNVRYLDGDVAAETMADIPGAARKGNFFLRFPHKFPGGKKAIGRASGREKVGKHVYITRVAV